jgi:hypothetical protein
VLMPKNSEMRGAVPFPLDPGGVRTSRSVISRMTALRGDKLDAGMC